MNKDEAEERTREGLADVDAGRIVDHQLVEAWAAIQLMSRCLFQDSTRAASSRASARAWWGGSSPL